LALEGLPVYARGGVYLGQVVETDETDMLVEDEREPGVRHRVPLELLSEVGDAVIESEDSGFVQGEEIARSHR